MNIILFDDEREAFLPLSYTRPISYFRVGIFTIKEKWEKYYQNISVKTEEYLSKKYVLKKRDDNIWINSRLIPNESIITEINNLRIGELLEKDSTILAYRSKTYYQKKLNKINSNADFSFLHSITDIFKLNGTEIKNDFLTISKGKKTSWQGELENHQNSNTKFGDYPIYIEKGAKIHNSSLDTTQGPIYIGKDTEIMQGSLIKGPFAMCNNSVLKMGAKIYESTTIGPFCKVGGEVNNSVFFGYSSKAHDGFLGNSVIGEWCNLGADTNNSNLKNNYENVKIWNYQTNSFGDTGLQFCGLIMGDHSKCGINTMFNTGTLVGVGANIFGSGFPRSFIASFSWGGSSGFTIHKLDKFLKTAEKVLKRRKKAFSDNDIDILSHVYDMTKRYRNEK
ncbi:MAG: glucose-1-phosphate thymidylyltransferase [Flavobacteriales bacterium]|nr:glucose-1-phosphate thymidylyltransferase [Flavobacteriales bacterium]